MPRQNTGQEVWKSLDSLTVYRQVSGGGSTTAAAAITAGASTVNFTATTNFTASDPLFIVGSTGTELNAIGAAVTPTTAVPLLYPAAMANPSASSLLEAVATVLGHVEQAGIQFSPQSPLVPFFSALGHTPIAYLRGYGELLATFGLTGFNILNLQTLFGTTESEGGAGTSADPYRGAIVAASVGTQGIQCVRAQGTRMDGTTVLLDFNGAVIEPQGAINLSRGVPTILPMQMRFTSVVVRIYT